MAPGALPFETTQNLLLSCPPLKLSLQAEFGPPPSAATNAGPITSSHRAMEPAPSPKTIEIARPFGFSITPAFSPWPVHMTTLRAQSGNFRIPGTSQKIKCRDEHASTAVERGLSVSVCFFSFRGKKFG